MEYLTSLEKYKELKKFLKLQTLDTSKLIQLYYQEMASIQKSLKSSDYGEIFCRAYYHLKEELIVIESKILTNIILFFNLFYGNL